MRSARFKRQTLALFFIVSVTPALTVGAVWYAYTQLTNLEPLYLDFTAFILPVIMVGIVPAVVMSFIFAELLMRPVREIHDAAMKLADGDYSRKFDAHAHGEFAEIGQLLDKVGTKLQQVLSQTSSETELIESERGKLHSVLNSMTDGVFALDRSGRIILFNKAASELTGRSITEVAGQLAEKVMPFRSGGELVMTRWLALGSSSKHKIGHWKGLELYRADGHSLTVNVEAVVLKDDPNGIAALITFHDLTKARQLEEMKIDFVALAAHELRTPLTQIKGYLDILALEGKGLNKTQKNFLDLAISSAAQLNDLMHNLLNVSRIEHGELSYRPGPLDYHAFLVNLMTSASDIAGQQNRRIELKMKDEPLPILADPSAIREVILNLVNNAITATQPFTGHIIIEVKTHRTSIDTSVTDNGTGIPSAAIPHLFTKFFRVDELRSSNRGTGLGLYICKSIIKAHGGDISVESKPGEGSTFTFVLPRNPIATNRHPLDNKATITRGAHGWIKDHSVR